MMSDQNTEFRFMKVVRDSIAFNDKKHTLDSDIASEIGADGFDAQILIAELEKEFGADFSDFPFYDFFVDESACCGGYLVWWIFPKWWKLYGLNWKPKRKITLRNLYDAALRGKWL